MYICTYIVYAYCVCIYKYIWGHFIMIKSSIFQEDTAILNLCVLNYILSRRDSQKRKAEWQREADKPQSQETATQHSSNCWDQQTKAVTEDAGFPGLTQEAPTAHAHTCRLHFPFQCSRKPNNPMCRGTFSLSEFQSIKITQDVFRPQCAYIIN